MPDLRPIPYLMFLRLCSQIQVEEPLPGKLIEVWAREGVQSKPNTTEYYWLA